MEWQVWLLLIFGVLLILMLTGMPIVLCFFIVNVIGMYTLFGGIMGLQNLINSLYASLNSFILLPIPLFILMGEVMFQSKIAPALIDVVGKWMGRLPGRLALLSVASGTLFSALTGTSIASVAMLGSTLVPEMERQGYKKPMSLGPILGSGGLAMLIPPSALAVLCGAIGEISISKILIGIIVPGLLVASIMAGYIILRCMLQPDLAPSYDVGKIPLSEKLRDSAKYVLPQGFVIFAVIGLMFLGIASPSEAAACGAIGTCVLAACYKRLTWEVIKKTTISSLSVTGMILIIIGGAQAFSQILAFTGASAGLAGFASGLPVAPIVIIFAMQIIILFLGCLMDVVSIMMITLPIFIPVVRQLGFSDVWFAVIFLINIEIAGISPPFGLSLFVMRGVAPKDTTMADVYQAALPFIGCSLLAMMLIMVFPLLALWLPGMTGFR
ncbi:MAG: C4-dicarboxylate ABC transporter permease [Deltaproteobacteria bacterium HGW-Deltaproteobacteria-21]|nr:MAG: C4-dicarboxylate ABC transporter permease [Deltaproteobacteria bacterium HGW-Deltaproteobacteria-21]